MAIAAMKQMLCLGVVSAVLTLGMCRTKTTGNGRCVSSCTGVRDGDYQSCNGCSVYASCSNEILHDNRPCPANLVWDDNKKQCEYVSGTCGVNVQGNGRCVSSCTGVRDGDYQSCNGCSVYASCSNEILHDNRPCPANLVWDDNKKRCEYVSGTCDVNVQGTGRCVSSCTGVRDGDYQSCKGCSVYASCSNEILHDNRPCPANLVWDDNKKRCEYVSGTCGVNVQGNGRCVSSCTGVRDGDYQSCNGCSVYASCSNGILHDNRPCPANLVWDDNKKRCEYVSGTCGVNVQVNGRCVSSCTGMRDGDYQSCNGCSVYASCSNGILHDNRPCPANLVWDDNKKRCEYVSGTCDVNVQGNGRCVSSCTGVRDGDYQSCNGCSVYASCSNEILHDNRPCPANLVWDDNKKRCEYVSGTCDANVQGNGRCVSSCTGVRDGDYQSCNGCSVYASCSNGILHDNRPCPANLVWDDNKKRCEYVSGTCGVNVQVNGRCVSSCTGMRDGDYQSCNGCSVYASCSNGILHDNRPCPANLVWDDNKKRCEYVSGTCDVNVQGNGRCVSSCTGVRDGDYQSCNGCSVYASCSNEILHDNRPCPANLVWDDNKKRCEYVSGTCDANVQGNGRCVSSCTGVRDGDYQSCNGCSVYASCSNGILHDNRPCPANLVWDDNKKRCEYVSGTCDVNVQGNGRCVSSCTGVRDGDYQSCNGCSVYASCSNEILHDNRPCPANLVWDDNKKRCEYVSGTCGVNVQGNGRCVSSCTGVRDGDYQSCNGCSVYASCSNEILHDNRPCPANLVWDDNKKRCEYVSGTCGVNVQGNGRCVSSCTGVRDGDYQSCNGCSVYASCSNEILHDNRPCPANLVWDDNKKRCEYVSGTCGVNVQGTGRCVSSCTGVRDGDYQSCNGCSVYASCSNEILHDNRPCPANLVWDDNKKQCEYVSGTCGVNVQGTGRCVSSCTGVRDGDYQSCIDCSVYASCSNGILHDNRPCPANLVWDDNKKRCEYVSGTCGVNVQGNGRCVSSCTGVRDGDYQSCIDCSVYASCSNGILHDNRPCPANLVWDDNKKRCEYVSETCGVNVQGNGRCVSSCTGVSDGDYQSCKGCSVYASCANEILHDNRACPANLVWDDNKKRCEYVSGTCDVNGQETTETTETTSATTETTSATTETTSVTTETTSATTETTSATTETTSATTETTSATTETTSATTETTSPTTETTSPTTETTSATTETTSPTIETTSATPSCDIDISCASWNFQYDECPVGGKQIATAYLVKQVSKSTCTFGTSFGVYDNGLWVNHGCRGDFRVCTCANVVKVDCDSWGYKYAKCRVNGANKVLKMRLLGQRSRSKCEFGYSFGMEGGYIWVDQGCRAAFEVCF